MKILVDINHPAHVHFFKNFIWEAEKRGHEILITSTRKDIAFELLDEYGFEYNDLGSYGKSLLSKALNMPLKDIGMLNIARKWDPDILLGIASHRITHAARAFGKKSFVFDDTEHAGLEILLYRPFATAIFTPSCFHGDLGKKQVRYPGYHELAYLHPSRFHADMSVLSEAGVREGEIFSIVRFVSWEASHDAGQSGLGLEQKRKAVEVLGHFGKVFISSEKKLPDDLEKYRLHTPLGKVHHLMNFASLMYGESATMASEAAVLGVHAIFCDFRGRGYTDEEEEKYALVSNYRLDKESIERSIVKAKDILSDPALRRKGKKKRAKLLADKIDVTAFMIEKILA